MADRVKERERLERAYEDARDAYTCAALNRDPDAGEKLGILSESHYKLREHEVLYGVVGGPEPVGILQAEHVATPPKPTGNIQWDGLTRAVWDEIQLRRDL